MISFSPNGAVTVLRGGTGGVGLKRMRGGLDVVWGASGSVVDISASSVMGGRRGFGKVGCEMIFACVQAVTKKIIPNRQNRYVNVVYSIFIFFQ